MKRTILLIAGILLVIQGLFTAKKSFAQWEPDVRLTNDPDISYPSYKNARNIAACGDTIHVTWYDERDGNPEIYYKRFLVENPGTERKQQRCSMKNFCPAHTRSHSMLQG